MDDFSKRGLNLVGTTVTNIKNDLLGLANVIESQVIPKITKLNSLLQEASKATSRMTGGGGGNVGGPNKVAESGAPTGDGGTGGPTNNVIASSPASGGRGAKFASVALPIAQAIGTALPDVPTSVMQDFLTQRSAFYGMGGNRVGIQAQTSYVNYLQKSLAKQGTALNAMDTTNALIAAQAAGLAGVGNFKQVMQGAAQASNITPGVGITGAVQAIGGTMNAPTTVNLARTIGINIRQADGSMLPFPQMVDKLWAFIKQSSGGRGMDKKSLQFSLQPGYGLYNMLNGLFNGDPVMIKMVTDGLLAKATFSGAPLGSITKDQMVEAGIQSATTRKIGNQVAAQTGLLASTAATTAGGYGGAADIGTGMNNLAAAMSNLTAALGGTKGFLSGFMGLGNGAMGGLLKVGLTAGIGGIAGGPVGAVLGALLGLTGRASGGPTDGGSPYIVGEKGPELFVPKTDGVVIPNHLLGNPHRQDGGPVIGNQQDFASALLSGLGITPTPENMANLVMWQKMEGGNWKNSAKFNPLNTSYQLPGSTKFGTGKSGKGVQAYTSWQQGLDATISTLTGKSAKERGYTAIVDFLRAGGGTSAEMLKLMQGSAWDAGRYKGGTSTSGGTTSGTTTPTVSPTQVVTSDPTAASRFAAAQAQAFGKSVGGPQGTNYNYNYGGITINIAASKDSKQTAKDVADAVKEIGKT